MIIVSMVGLGLGGARDLCRNLFRAELGKLAPSIHVLSDLQQLPWRPRSEYRPRL